MAMSLTEGSFGAGFEAFKPVIRHKRQHRSSEAAAVDADGSLAREQLLAERDRKRHTCLPYIAFPSDHLCTCVFFLHRWSVVSVARLPLSVLSAHMITASPPE